MTPSTLQPSSSSTAGDLAPAVAQVSMVFARLFHHRWQRAGADPKTLATWQRAFEVAGLTPTDIQRGLRAAALLTWPPTAGEFIDLCHEPVPSLEAALAEAARWSHTVEIHDGTWSHPAIGAAARKVGDHALRHLDERSLARRFEPLYREAITQHRAGVVLDLPLPRLAHDAKPGPQSEAQVQRSVSLINDLRQHFNLAGGP